MLQYWSVATANHPELVLSYAATIMDSQLVPLARQRAALPDWSHGGWPDQFGAEVMGMSCGPTPDWDHDFGCAPGFGGFKGFAFVSCTGPFDGMACCFDDGTRFVAGMVATPLVRAISEQHSRANAFTVSLTPNVAAIRSTTTTRRWTAPSSARRGSPTSTASPTSTRLTPCATRAAAGWTCPSPARRRSARPPAHCTTPTRILRSK